MDWKEISRKFSKAIKSTKYSRKGDAPCHIVSFLLARKLDREEHNVVVKQGFFRGEPSHYWVILKQRNRKIIYIDPTYWQFSKGKLYGQKEEMQKAGYDRDKQGNIRDIKAKSYYGPYEQPIPGVGIPYSDEEVKEIIDILPIEKPKSFTDELIFGR